MALIETLVELSPFILHCFYLHFNLFLVFLLYNCQLLSVLKILLPPSVCQGNLFSTAGFMHLLASWVSSRFMSGGTCASMDQSIKFLLFSLTDNSHCTAWILHMSYRFSCRSLSHFLWFLSFNYVLLFFDRIWCLFSQWISNIINIACSINNSKNWIIPLLAMAPELEESASNGFS